MDLSRKTVVQVVMLALIAQVTFAQHWSYGWLPGGKRSVGELEATIRATNLLSLKCNSLRQYNTYFDPALNYVQLIKAS
uniref:Progonadoliberin n=1 Tax=Hucho hucho TaxID=62062 RepID=A0A4W5KTB8_9TELE